MRWIKSKDVIESHTDEGYHLKVICVSDIFFWYVYYRGMLLKFNKTKFIYKKSLASAKRQAISLMVTHMLKKNGY
jgi:hypothetical protein